jgi:threonine/homoserine/homoserine lactone efflux protein
LRVINPFVVLFLSSFTIAFSGAIMPGPLLAATIEASARRGILAGPLLMVGHGLLELVLLFALFLGLAPFIRQDGVFTVIALTGSAILLWMAIGMFRTRPSLQDDLHGGTLKGGNLVVNGALMSAANPYWVIWWATIGLGYVLYCRQFGPWGMVAFFVGHILADVVWYTAVSGAVAKGRRFLTDLRYRWLIRSCASFLLVFAGYFFWMGLKKIGMAA